MGDLPADLSDAWQIVDLAAGRTTQSFALPCRVHRRRCMSRSRVGLARLRAGRARARPSPEVDPDRETAGAVF